jgi:hypothetical protein
LFYLQGRAVCLGPVSGFRSIFSFENFNYYENITSEYLSNPMGDESKSDTSQLMNSQGRAFGVLKLKNCKFGALTDQEGRVVLMSLHNKYTRSYPEQVVELIKHLKVKDGDVDNLECENFVGLVSGPSMSRNSRSCSA